MTSVLSIAVFTQVLLVASGLALLQLVNHGERIRIVPMIPYAWGVGTTLLYLVGGIFVRSEWLLPGWHWAVAGGMTALVIAGAAMYLRRDPVPHETTPVSRKPVYWYDVLIMVAILTKVGLVAYICMVNPVVDSDATYLRGYMSLAKKIGENASYTEVMERATGFGSPVGPSLLSAWIRLFLDRWHDSVSALPWLLAWLFSGYAAFVICYRLSRQLTASLVLAYLFLSLPIAAVHVFRAGFIDLLVMYFFTSGIGVLSLAFLAREKPGAAWLAAGAVAVLGAALCKSEGKMWAVFLTVMWINYYLYAYKNIPWKKLVVAQLLLASALLAAYYLFIDEELMSRIFEDRRLSLLVPRSFEKEAFSATVSSIYLAGSFGIWWWAVGLAGLYLLGSGKIPPGARLLAFFALSIFLSIVYFANFTENIRFTLIGTNVSRFLLQVSGVFIPLYCALVMSRLLPYSESGVSAPAAAK